MTSSRFCPLVLGMLITSLLGHAPVAALAQQPANPAANPAANPTANTAANPGLTETPPATQPPVTPSPAPAPADADANADANANANANADVAEDAAAADGMTLRQLLRAGGTIGLVILGLSMAMVALIVEHLLTIRRKSLMPEGLAESVSAMVATGRFAEADRLCRERPSFLGEVLAEGLAEAPLGYAAVEKSMEDASAAQSARLFRKIEYLSVIGTIAPMLGLLGTVWGMIVAFQEFANKLNPAVAELAPGIYQALVTTLMGLGVAVPALTAFAIFRNRIDELVAEASLTAEHAWAGFKRASLGSGSGEGRRKTGGGESKEAPRRERRVPPVAIERPEEPAS